MTLIPDREKNDLKRAFRTDLKNKVSLKLYTQRASALTIPGRECRYCGETQQLMEELASLSPKVELEIIDIYAQSEETREAGIERIPAIVLGDDTRGSRLKFYGIPMGHEFPTIIEGIKTLSRGVSPLSMDSRKKLKRVNHPVHIQVFVTPDCGFCPQVARLAHAIAMENRNIRSDVVEVSEFPSLGQMYGVRSVPQTVINEVIRVNGAVAEDDFIDKVMQAGVREEEAKS